MFTTHSPYNSEQQGKKLWDTILHASTLPWFKDKVSAKLGEPDAQVMAKIARTTDY